MRKRTIAIVFLAIVVNPCPFIAKADETTKRFIAAERCRRFLVLDDTGRYVDVPKANFDSVSVLEIVATHADALEVNETSLVNGKNILKSPHWISLDAGADPRKLLGDVKIELSREQLRLGWEMFFAPYRSQIAANNEHVLCLPLQSYANMEPSIKGTWTVSMQHRKDGRISVEGPLTAEASNSKIRIGGSISHLVRMKDGRIEWERANAGYTIVMTDFHDWLKADYYLPGLGVREFQDARSVVVDYRFAMEELSDAPPTIDVPGLLAEEIKRHGVGR